MNGIKLEVEEAQAKAIASEKNETRLHTLIKIQIDMADPKLSNVLGQVNDMIDEYGYMGIKVQGDGVNNPSFVYTVGLTETYAHPEFIIIGFDCNQAEKIIQCAVEMIEDEKSVGVFENVQIDHVLEGVPVGCKSVTNENLASYLKIANIRYFGIFHAKQLILPDLQGKLPWEPEWNNDFQLQKKLYL